MSNPGRTAPIVPIGRPPKFRLCFVLPEWLLSGGTMVVWEYAARVAARGHEVSIVTTINPTSPLTLPPPPKVRLITCEAKLRRDQPMANLGIAIRLLAQVPPVDFLFATHTTTIPLVLVATRLLRRGRPVWLAQDFREQFVNRPFECMIWRFTPRAFDAAFTISLTTSVDAWRAGQRRIAYVGEGLSDLETLLAQPVVPRNSATVLTLNDRRPWKGLEDLLASFRLVKRTVPDATLTIVTKEHDLQVNNAGVQCVVQPTRATLVELYARCSVFVSASWAEGFGLPPLEAMACGAPVVTTNSRGVQDYVIADTNCLLVPPRNPDELAGAIVRVLEDRSLAARLGAAGRQTARQFTWDAAVDRFESALGRLASVS